MRQIISITAVLIALNSFGQKNLQMIVKDGRIPKNELLIKVDKSDYTLSVFHKSKKLITYPCVFGFNPVDDKKQEGDGCTPEGTFKIISKYHHRSWTYFIWFDYPNKDSWRKFKQNRAAGLLPDEATVGGEIGIHGVPEGLDEWIAQKENWTLGCICLSTSDVTDLFKSIGDKTLIEITP
jgi:murein L,D-transpeptidase YafK